MTRHRRRAPGNTHVFLSIALCGVLWVIGGFWLSTPAWAHTQTLTISEIAVDGGTVTWAVRVRVEDLLEPLDLGASDGAPEILAVRDRALAYVGDRLSVELANRSCPQSPSTVQSRAREDGRDGPPVEMRFEFRFHCEPESGPAPVRLHYRLFFDLDPLHTGFAWIDVNGQPFGTHMFRERNETLTLADVPVSWSRQMLQYLALGVEHIFLGYDHLAFLAALILGAILARRGTGGTPPEAASSREALLNTVKIVTAFTVAHSITLIYAALSPDAVETGWVEPAIALSVAYVGFENLRPRVARRRWLLVFAFGLVHGFGFASVLSEIGLPRVGLVRSLLAFNVGVELGQIAVVSACLPLLLALARRHPARFELWAVRGASLAIGIAGTVWFITRVM